MTTRILSFRALRLVVASLLVGLLVASKAMFVPRLLLVGFALAWLVVPGDRRWFVPGSLLVVAAGFFWPLATRVKYQLGDGSQLVVNRLTGAVDMLPPNRVRTNPLVGWYRLHPSGWVRLTPVPRPSLLLYLGITRSSSPPRAVASDSAAFAIPPVPPDLAVKGGCLSLSGGGWVPCATPPPAPPPPPWRPQ